MATKDAITKNYMRDNAHFADAVNFHFFNGEQVVLPENLKELDTTVIALPYGDDGDPEAVQKYRDLLKLVTIKCDDHAVYLMMGIENQSQMHYAMPVRVMVEDALQYSMQLEQIAKRHRQNGDHYDSSAEYLSGFRKDDKLKPVVTLTIYFGSEPWTAPTDLHSMLDASPEVLSIVDNYHLHLIDPYAIPERDFEKLRTELRHLLKSVKHSRTKKELNEMLDADESFHKISRETGDAINAVIHANLKFPEEGENVDLCDAIKQMVDEAVVVAKNETTRDNAVTFAKKLIRRGKQTLEEIAEDTGLSLDEVQALANEET